MTSTRKELAELFSKLIGGLLAVSLIGLNCYGSNHAEAYHERTSFIPVAIYYGLEGLFWHSDGVEEFCAKALSCVPPDQRQPKEICVARTRVNKAALTGEERARLEGSLREAAKLDCGTLTSLFSASPDAGLVQDGSKAQHSAENRL